MNFTRAELRHFGGNATLRPVKPPEGTTHRCEKREDRDQWENGPVSHGSRLEPKTQKLSEVFEAPWTDPLQLEAVHSGLWDTAHPLLLALGDKFRLWSLFIRLGVDVTLVKDIGAVKVSELRPTAVAVIVVPSIAWSVVLDESKCALSQPLQPIESPVG
jgi:hypothetical protein